jgi:PAS domain S-box-containing protein
MPARATAAQPRGLTILIWTMFALGLASTVAAFSTSSLSDPLGLVALVLLAAASERLSVGLYFDGRLSISFVCVVLAALLLGPAGTGLVTASITLAGFVPSGRSWRKLAFNFGQHTFAGFAAAESLRLAGLGDVVQNPSVVVPVGATIGAMLFLISTTAVAMAVAFSSGRTVRETHRESFRWMLPHYVALGSVAGGVAFLYESAGLAGLLVAAVPVVLARYAMKQVIDKTRDNVVRLEASNDKLERAHAENNAILEGIPDSILRVSADLVVLDARLSGAPSDAVADGTLVGRDLSEALPWTARGPVMECLAAAVLHGHVGYVEYEVPGDASSRWFEARVSPAKTGECLVMVRDVTDARRAEEARRRAEELLRTVTANAPLILCAVDMDGRVVLLNGKGSEAFGPSAGEAVGHSIESLLGPGPTSEQFRRALAGETFGAVDDLAGRTFETHYAPLRDIRGQVVGAVGVALDVTERRRMDAAMVETQKLESLGVLAGGIAHDFNNLLVGIIGNAGLALDEMEPASPVAATIRDIELAGHRAAELARQMLAYSGKGRFVVEPVDLNSLVIETGQLLRASIGKGVRLAFDTAPALPLIEADTTQIRQVVMNLVINASDAIGEHEGRISVTTGVRPVSAEQVAESFLSLGLPGGDYVYLRVTDNGSGMDAETRARIFDPFFTTKFTGRGLGLAATLGIIRGHGGAIRVESEPGVGSTFELLFPPTAASPGAANRTLAAAGAPVVASGTILVVDDEATVRRVTAKALSHMGFQVLEAADGQEGVETFAGHAADITCVLLDMTMPRLNGIQAFEAIRKLRPEVPIVLMSGYAEEEATSQFAGKGLSAFVQKPYEIGTLKEGIWRALAESERTTNPAGQPAGPTA